MNEKNIIFISEMKHVDELAPFLSAHPDIQKEGYLLVPLDAEIEYLLTEKNVTFHSGRGYRTTDTEPMTHGEEWLLKLFNDERWSFFTYRGVSLARLYFFPLQAYLMSLLYYADIIANVLARHTSTARCIVFSPTDGAPSRGFCLEVQKMKALVDVVTCLATQRGIEALVPERIMPTRVQTSITSFEIKRALFSVGVGLLNFVVKLFRRPRRLRILASDYWSNLLPYLKQLDSVEVFQLDRMQAFNVGLSNLWKFRMRFLHLGAYPALNSPARENASDHIQEVWQSLRQTSAVPELRFRNFSLQPLAVQMLDTIVTDVVSRVLRDIDNAHALLARVKPDVVELRSTMSVQTHFVILAQVARSLGIPSLEMQHGIEYYGPGSMDRRHSAEHMGVYGPLTQRELHAAEDTITTHVIGSPRFDVYESLLRAGRAKQPATHSGLSVLCISPPISLSIIDTFDIEEYFSGIAVAVRGVTGAEVIIKLRNGRYRQSFYESAITRIFDGVPHQIKQDEPLVDLFHLSDIVVSNYSTATLEALQCGKPLIYFGVSPAFNLMADVHLTSYEQEGAVNIVKTNEEFSHALKVLMRDPHARERMSRAATDFLEKNFAFDGRAGERAAELITSLETARRRHDVS